ncbi:MAG: sulfatase-like hydrolase/transferase [Myxococcota bacterium]
MWSILTACQTPPAKPHHDPDTTSDPVITSVTDPPTTEPSTEVPPTGDTGPVGPQSVLQFDGPPPKNLLIVSLDTTRRDFIGRFSGTDHTPNLDEVLQTAVVLENHRSCSSWTAPSMTCVTTGLTPYELDWWPWTSDPYVQTYDDDLPTLAGQLQFQQGFRTTLVSANDVFGPGLNFTRGFDTYTSVSWQPAADVADAAVDEARALVEGGSSPYYLHVHFIDPHADYCPPPEYIDAEDFVDQGIDLCDSFYDYAWGGFWYESYDWQQTFIQDSREVYEAELTYWDHEFGQMWERLDQLGALDDTLVVFVTDHGEQFFERGGWGHGNTLAAEENRSTAAFWAKNLVPQAWTGNTVHQDIAATLQDFFQVEPPIPSSGVVVGLAPDDRYLRGMLYWGQGAARLSIVQFDKELTYDFWGERHLYDLALDPTGLTDSYDPTDPDVIAMWGPMQVFVDEVVAKWPSAGAPYAPGP